MLYVQTSAAEFWIVVVWFGGPHRIAYIGLSFLTIKAIFFKRKFACRLHQITIYSH